MSPGGWYFGEKYPVLYSPGMRMEQSLRSPEMIGSQEPLLLLDASHSPGSGYLPGMQEQRDAISRLFSRTKIVDSSSTSWPEARSRLAASGILHYMGHGRPDGSGTSLDYNGSQSLRAKDFTPELLRRSQLVVLAACSSGRGKNNGLWDTNSLIHTFLAAGVPRVIASHWNVDSETTSQLMISFYQHVAADKTVPQAIYEARKEILEKRPHPYYWAGFSLTGRVN
jgi:CHAT domain-containing protein